jgi:hypothetical protein
MARKNKRSNKQTTKKQAATASKKTATKRQEREPWTPWGKWAKARRERIERKKKEKEDRRKQRIRARQIRRLVASRGTVFLGLIVFACVIGLVVTLVLGRPYPWESLRDTNQALLVSQTLPEREARWESLAIYHYTIEIEYRDEGSEVWCGPATIEVKDGVVVDLPTPVDTHWFPMKTCNALLDRLVIEESFDWLDEQLAQIKPAQTYLRASFDPDFGFPAKAEAGVYRDPEPGCCWVVTWQDLRPIDD